MLLLSIPHLPLDVNERNTLDIAKKEKRVECNKIKGGLEWRNKASTKRSFPIWKIASSLDDFRRVVWDFDRNKTCTSTTTPKEHTSLGAAFYLTKSLFIFCS